MNKSIIVLAMASMMLTACSDSDNDETEDTSAQTPVVTDSGAEAPSGPVETPDPTTDPGTDPPAEEPVETPDPGTEAPSDPVETPDPTTDPGTEPPAEEPVETPDPGTEAPSDPVETPDPGTEPPAAEPVETPDPGTEAPSDPVETSDPTTDPGTEPPAEEPVETPDPGAETPVEPSDDGVVFTGEDFGITIDEFTSDAEIDASVVSLQYDDAGNGVVEVKLTNGSSRVIHGAMCGASASFNGAPLETASADIIRRFPLDSGESGLGYATFESIQNFSAVDAIDLDCTWNRGSNRKDDIETAGIVVTIGEETIIDNIGVITLFFNNNSANVVNSAVCGVEAKRDGIVHSIARFNFNRQEDILPGMSVEDIRGFPRVATLDDFDDITLDNINCSYTVVTDETVVPRSCRRNGNHRWRVIAAKAR